MTADWDALYRIVFVACVAVLFLLERVPSWQQRPAPGARRWASNAGLFVIGSVVGSLVLPIGLVALAETRAPGRLERFGLPLAAEVALTFLLLDLWKYWEHRLLHRVPLLWRAHLVHHSDTAVDVTTAERHHPIEVVLSTALMVAIVMALGASPAALGIYLVVATIVAFYAHANLRLPAGIDRALSRVIVTAPVHRVHHSSLRTETDSNYGAVLTLWDRLFGTFVEPRAARVPHLWLDYFHADADTRLWRVLLQPFVYRRGQPYPARADAAASAPRRLPLSPAARRVLLLGLASIVVVAAVTWPTLADMSRVWASNESYQYAWLVVPVLAYLLAQPSARSIWMSPRPGTAGVVVVAAAALGWAAGVLVGIDAFQAACFVVMLQGVALATLGGPAYRRLFPVLAVLFFMFPYGDLLQPALRTLTRDSIDVFCTVAGLPHTVDGFVVLIEGRRYVVVDECAGLTYVTLAAFVGYCFGVLLDGRLARAVSMAALGASLGVASNLARVDIIVGIDAMRGTQMDLGAHGAMQWIMLLVALAALVHALMRARLPAEATLPPVASAPTLRGAGPPAAAGLVALAVAGALHLASAREVMAVDSSEASLPRSLAGWTLASPATHDAEGPRAPTRTLRATYRHDERQLDLVVVQAMIADAKLAESALAPGAHATWREKETRSETACALSQCVTLRHVTWQREHSDEQRHVYFAYDVGGYATSSLVRARLARGWHRMRGDAVDARLAAFDSTAPLDMADLALAWRELRASIAASGELRVAGDRGRDP